MLRPVIAAIDPNRPHVAAAALGAQLAAVTGAPLLLASVYLVDPALDVVLPEVARERRLAVERVLADIRRQLKTSAAPGLVAITAVAATDSEAWALHRLATARRARMLVLGSSSRGRLGRALPGAVTDRLLFLGAGCPIAIAPAGYAAERALEPIRLVGVAFVESADGYAALAAARALAGQAGARVRVLTVMKPGSALATAMPGGIELADAERTRHEHAERVLQKGLDSIPDGLSAGGDVLDGGVPEALDAASADLDVLVCGTRGLGPLQDVVAGGKSHALVRHAHAPVLVVRASAPD
jgi:nucleotide-binding universal stress UspA family protein